jgi:Domain of unknown function (DUF4287)
MSFQAYINNIKVKTGKTPDDFRVLAEKKGLLKRGVKATMVTDWLQKDFGLGLGHARAVYATLKPHMSKRVARRHSITPSARADNVIGNVRSRVFAVWRLITNSSFVFCSTGKSAGLAPLRIFPVYIPTRRYASKRLGP